MQANFTTWVWKSQMNSVRVCWQTLGYVEPKSQKHRCYETVDIRNLCTRVCLWLDLDIAMRAMYSPAGLYFPILLAKVYIGS